MVAIKTHQASRFLNAPDPKLTAFLFYGTDAGLVVERARDLAGRLAARETPPGEVVRIDESDLDNDPDRIGIELQTIPMFGSRKIVRATAGRRIGTSLIKPIMESPMEGLLILEAGNLRPDESLRALFEKSERAAAVACFPDEASDIGGLVRETLAGTGLTMQPEARTLLISRLGADRAVSRGEIEKLVLYAHGKGTITEEDVDAIVGDAAEIVLERIPLAAASGRGTVALADCSAALASGESAQTIILATQRYFQRLHRTRTLLDQGSTLDAALRQLRPQLHFKQKDAFTAQCRGWSGQRLTQALSRIARAAKAARLSSALEVPLTEALLLDLAREGQQALPGRRAS